MLLSTARCLPCGSRTAVDKRAIAALLEKRHDALLHKLFLGSSIHVSLRKKKSLVWCGRCK